MLEQVTTREYPCYRYAEVYFTYIPSTIIAIRLSGCNGDAQTLLLCNEFRQNTTTDVHADAEGMFWIAISTTKPKNMFVTVDRPFRAVFIVHEQHLRHRAV